jgi:muramoyltetrapeptide carboxypeptidase LdcA involved in peptidoglycan recycling
MDGRIKKNLGMFAVNMSVNSEREKTRIDRTLKLRQMIGTVNKMRLVKLNKGQLIGGNLNFMYNMFSDIYVLLLVVRMLN